MPARRSVPKRRALPPTRLSSFSIMLGCDHSRTLAGARTVAGLAAAAARDDDTAVSSVVELSGSGALAITGRAAAGEAVEATGVSTLGEEAAASTVEAAGEAAAREVVASIPGTTEFAWAASVKGSFALAASV